MKREITATATGTWLYTIRVYGTTLVSYGADRKAALNGLMDLLAEHISSGTSALWPVLSYCATEDDGAVTGCR